MLGKWLSGLAVPVLCALVPAWAGAAGESAPAAGAFKLDAGNGYKIVVLAGSRRADGQGSIALLVGRGRSAATYSAAATVTATSIRADLGSLGKVDVDLVPAGKKETARPICGGRPVTFERASYEGTIEFHGEGGYTDVTATSVPVDHQIFLDIGCPGSVFGEERGGDLPGASLTLGRRHRSGPLSLEVKKNNRRARTYIQVEESETRNGIEIHRGTGMLAGPAAFEYDPLLRTATVEPSAPFSGKAVYRRSASKSERWSGDLAVDLPGKPNLALTGVNLPIRLVHAHWSRHTYHRGPGERLLLNPSR